MNTSSFRSWLLSVIAAAAVAVAAASPVSAAPFFSGVGGLFDPEIDVVESGVLNDVQATVSHDRKYVTLNMRPSNSDLLSLRSFTFQSNQPPDAGDIGGF